MVLSNGPQNDSSNDQNEIQDDNAAVIKDKLVDLNRSSLDEVTRIIDGDPAMDLWPALRKILREYKLKHEEIIKKPSNVVVDPAEEPDPTHEQHEGYCPLVVRRGDISILWPLSDSVTELLGGNFDLTDTCQKETLLLALGRIIKNGRVLHELSVRAVVQISPEVVVKIGRVDTLIEMHNLQHIHQTGDIPAPQPLGVISVAATAYTFTTFIPGITLERIWSELTLEQKGLIRQQLCLIFAKLRTLPLPSKHLGGGAPAQCHDTRRILRKSVDPIENVAQFHDFILAETYYARGWADFLRSSLRDDYAVVMTHGDLHPRNIIVSDAQDVIVAGIIDWEHGGGYPEYWEYVTALRTAWTGDEDDWHLFLPERAIGKYVDEKIKDSQIGRAVNGF